MLIDDIIYEVNIGILLKTYNYADGKVVNENPLTECVISVDGEVKGLGKALGEGSSQNKIAFAEALEQALLSETERNYFWDRYMEVTG